MVKTNNRRNKKARKTRKYVGGNGELESIKTDKVLYPLLAPFSNKTTLYSADTLLPNIDLYIATEKKALSEIKKNAIRSVLDQYKSNINQIDTDKYYSNKIDAIYASIQAKEDTEQAKLATEAAKKAEAAAKKAEAAAKKENAEKAKVIAEAEKEAKRKEAERIAKENAAKRKEAERKAREEVERIAKEKEAKRKEAERIAKENAAKRKEAERIETERKEAERIETERKESERKESERIESERIESERIEAEKKEAEIFTKADMVLLMNSDFITKFDTFTAGKLNHFDKYKGEPFFDTIRHIETIVLILVGILNTRLTQHYKIVLKGGKGLQMELGRIGWEKNILTDDIDLLLLPIGEYNRDAIKKMAEDLSTLINMIVNHIRKYSDYIPGNREGISILQPENSKNPNIVKMSYMYYGTAKPFLDIDFKEDTERFFSEDKITYTHFLLEKTDLVYYHQTLDSFIEEKKIIKQKYTDCKCPTDIPQTNVPTTPECEPLCPGKKFMLDKFRKYDPLIEEYENRKKQSNKTLKKQSNKSSK